MLNKTFLFNHHEKMSLKTVLVQMAVLQKKAKAS